MPTPVNFKKFKDKHIPLNYDPSVDGITQSLLTSLRKCETKARFTIRGYYRPGASKAIVLGNIFHEALFVLFSMYKSGKYASEYFTTPECVEVVRDTTLENLMPEYTDSDQAGKDHFEYGLQLLCVTLPLYVRYWWADFFIGDNQKTFIEVERPFSTPVQTLYGPIALRGKKDAIIQETDLSRWLMEHKTKSMIPKDALAMTISRDLQVMLYIYAYYLENNVWLDGVLYNIIRMTGKRKTVAQSWNDFWKNVKSDIVARPAWYFIRYKVPIPVEALKFFAVKLGKELDKFYMWLAQDPKFDIQCTHECNNVYGKCPFIELCDSNFKDYSRLCVKKRHHMEL